MLLALAVLLVAVTRAQELTAAYNPAMSPPLYLTELVPAGFEHIPAASDYVSVTAEQVPAAANLVHVTRGQDAQRKSYYNPSYFHTMCNSNKPDALSSVANALASIAKIVAAVTAVLALKLFLAKLFLLPLKILLLAKLGLKAAFLWPIISKMVKAFRKRRGTKSRMSRDCSRRATCLLQRAASGGWGAQLGVATAFALAGEPGDDEDGPHAMLLLDALAGGRLARCMTLPCSDGVDIS